MSAFETLNYEVAASGVATIALNQPQTRNALSAQLLSERAVDGQITRVKAGNIESGGMHLDIELLQSIEQLRRIGDLTAAGLNLEGVRRVLELEADVASLATGTAVDDKALMALVAFALVAVATIVTGALAIAELIEGDSPVLKYPQIHRAPIRI